MTSILIWKKIIDKKRGELSERSELKRTLLRSVAEVKNGNDYLESG